MPSVVPVPRKLYSRSRMPDEFSPPERETLTPGMSDQLSRVSTSMSTTPSW